MKLALWRITHIFLHKDNVFSKWHHLYICKDLEIAVCSQCHCFRQYLQVLLWVVHYFDPHIQVSSRVILSLHKHVFWGTHPQQIRSWQNISEEIKSERLRTDLLVNPWTNSVFDTHSGSHSVRSGEERRITVRYSSFTSILTVWVSFPVSACESADDHIYIRLHDPQSLNWSLSLTLLFPSWRLGNIFRKGWILDIFFEEFPKWGHEPPIILYNIVFNDIFVLLFQSFCLHFIPCGIINTHSCYTIWCFGLLM